MLEITIAPSGSQLTNELTQKVKVVDTADRDLIDALADMKVAPADTVFLMDANRAVFLVNNSGLFDLSFRILHPEEDDLELFNAVWLGLERFNSIIKEAELIAKLTPIEEEPEPRGRFTKQYARIDKNGDPKKLLKPSYMREVDLPEEEGDDE